MNYVSPACYLYTCSMLWYFNAVLTDLYTIVAGVSEAAAASRAAAIPSRDAETV